MTTNWNRRDFLKTTSAATLSALAAGYPRALLAAEAEEKIKPSADTLIVLWLAGGMAQTETFDPKRYTPFERGMKPSGLFSTFPTIDTAVDHIKFTAGLEKIARVMDRGTLIRSYTAGDLGFILHSRHQYQWHTGYAPPQTVAAPHLGAIIARTLGPKNPAVPAFINIGQRFDLGEGEELKAFTTAGFLGSEHGPFNIPYPEQAADAVRPPAGMSPSRFESRDKFYRKLLAQSPVGDYGSDYQKESLLRSVDNAHRLLSSPAAKAFDLTQEPAEHIRKYWQEYDPGKRFDAAIDRSGSYEAATIGRFGLGCLLARRLAEVGARYIEVTTEYIPFLNWDTHEHGHEKMVNMKKSIDSPVSQLVLDLEERGLLDRTLIVLASEFSRDALIEGKPDKKVKDQVPVPDVIDDEKNYGMHRHFTDAGCVLLFGGGIKKGYLHGLTADERPFKTIEKRVVIEDLHASLFHAMGIPPKLSYEIEKRPFYVTRDGEGKPILDLFA
ncbi:MAG TPA: DUF1501 domain-containing protein [Candidatus Angelobacter sp.]|nr:DUF1501 domain-containing protein [Candidatus Angelobacter sp.]